MAGEIDVTLELAYGADPTADPSTWSWTPVQTDAKPIIAIVRGRANELSGEPQSMTAQAEVNNDAGVYSPRNVTGANFGQLGANIPVRVRVNPGSGYNTRAVGLAVGLSPDWSAPQVNERIVVNATGPLRRLDGANWTAQSYLYGQIQALPNLVAHWPLEDAAGSTVAASAVTGTPAMVTDGTVLFAEETPPTGASAAPDLTAGGLVGTVPDGTFVTGGGATITVTNQTRWTVQFAALLAASGSTCVVAEWATTGGVAVWDVQATASAINLRYWTGATATTLSTVAVDALDDLWHGYCVTIDATKLSITATLNVDGTTDSDTVALVGGRIRSFRPNPDRSATVRSVVQVGIAASASAPAVVLNPEDAGSGDDAQTRFQDVADAYGIVVDVAGTPGDSELVGPWQATDPMTLLRAAAAADEGLMIERRTGELGFDPHRVRENQAVAWALDCDAGHIESVKADDGDLLLRNDWTITRDGGGQVQYDIEEGRLGTAMAGRYNDAATLNLHDDDQPRHHASYRAHVGTVDEIRFPAITVDLAAHPELVDDWLACDVGSRITVANLEQSMVGPGPHDLIIEGYTEVIDGIIWTVTLNCAPYSPYLIGTWGEDDEGDDDDFVGHYDSDRIEVIVAADDNDTAWTVATDPVSITTAAHPDSFPVLLRCLASPVPLPGETIRLTAAVAVSAAFGAVGAVDHDDNASLTPGLPAGLAAGQLMLLFAAIRNSGTGTVNAPSGWARLGEDEGLEPFSATENVAVFYRYALGGGADVGPTVTFTAGAAGATTSAQIASLTGVSGRVKAAVAQLNSSAGNIAYPALEVPVDNCVIVYFGWKQDDWTSVAAITGATEIGDTSSTSGSDQGIVWDFAAQTLRSDITAGSFTVTGGASAISRGAVVALMTGVRTWTVERAVNGVATAQPVGTQLQLHPYDALQMGL